MAPRAASSAAAAGAAALSDPASTIEFTQANPKRRGSSSFERYDVYKKARTVGDAWQSGANAADLKNDHAKGYLRLVGGVRPFSGLGVVLGRGPAAAPQQQQQQQQLQQQQHSSVAFLAATQQQQQPQQHQQQQQQQQPQQQQHQQQQQPLPTPSNRPFQQQQQHSSALSAAAAFKRSLVEAGSSSSSSVRSAAPAVRVGGGLLAMPAQLRESTLAQRLQSRRCAPAATETELMQPPPEPSWPSQAGYMRSVAPEA
ncbi:unnamed protein product, partial [Polarella glacialis]